ncbi:MAG: immunoglobulin domain-containing protein [Planctomycetes bacterium]|nr:immunoglobulin domain-containing protein [Planctomycetota bacterium]
MPFVRPHLFARLAWIAMLFGLAADSPGQTWQPVAAVPTGGSAREYAAGVAAGSTIVALGGKPFTVPGDGDGVVHALTNGVWTAPPHLDGEGPLIRQGAGVDDLGRIIFFGGVREGDGEPGHARVYDLVLGVRQSIAIRGASAPDDYFAFAADDFGRIYSLGGSAFDGAGISAYAERYIGSSNLWEPIAPMLTPVRDACGAFDGAGHMLVIGGIAASGARTTNVAQYDIATNTWSDTAVADIPVAVSGARAVRGADGLIYLLGGRSGAGLGAAENRTWFYRSEDNTWSSGAPMANARTHFAAALGSDSYIYAVGGSNDTGGTNACERLYTPICPQIANQPQNATVWNGGAARFSVTVTGGSPMSYQWRRDGAPLADGPTGTGSSISGAATATLTIAGTGAADIAAYDVVATNGCGSTVSAAATMTIRQPPTSETQWQAANLHPAWVDGSTYANAISNGRVGGSGVMTTTLPDGRVYNLHHPILWDINLEPSDITPPGSVGGAIYDIGGDFLVGWFWHTWQCWSGGQYWTCAWQSAGFWIGDPPVFQERHASGSEYDAIYQTDGVAMAGSATYDDASGNYWSHALYHPAPNYWGIVMNPGGASSAWLAAVDGPNQYGYINTPYPSPVAHAAMWSGSAASFVDLHPAGYSRSFISDAADGQAVGSVYLGDTPHAGLWVGGQFTDLNPPGAGGSSLSLVKGGLQAGTANNIPGLWLGTADSFIPLPNLAPPGYTGAYISDLEIEANGAVTLVGGAYNTGTARSEAFLWRPIAACPGDLNGDRVVDLSDLTTLLAHFGTASGASSADGDLDADGDVDLADLTYLLAQFGASC